MNLICYPVFDCLCTQSTHRRPGCEKNVLIIDQSQTTSSYYFVETDTQLRWAYRPMGLTMFAWFVVVVKVRLPCIN